MLSGGGKKQLPSLQSIPVDHLFQILGVDIMELLLTTSGNTCVIAFQDLFTKWPTVFAIPD